MSKLPGKVTALTLATMVAAATLALATPDTAEAAGGTPNINVRVSTMRPVVVVAPVRPHGYTGGGAAPPYSAGGIGLDHRGTTQFDPSTQFDNVGTVSANRTTVKPPK